MVIAYFYLYTKQIVFVTILSRAVDSSVKMLAESASKINKRAIVFGLKKKLIKKRK